MYQVCICDDKEEEIQKIEGMLGEFSREYPQFPIEIMTFTSARELMRDLRESGGYDVYVLDVLMPELSGIQLARQIRERRERGEILFLTSSREYAVEAYGVQAADYLVRPVKRENFFRAMKACIERLGPSDAPVLLLKTKVGIQKVPLRELVMVESFNHLRVCTLADGRTVETAENLSALYKRLERYSCFRAPHRAYIVNLDFVEGLTGDCISLWGGHSVPVSRRSSAAFKKAFLDYAVGQGMRAWPPGAS